MGESTIYRIQFHIGPLQYEKLQQLKSKSGFPPDKSTDLFVKKLIVSFVEGGTFLEK
jgi:hypothetical protein